MNNTDVLTIVNCISSLFYRSEATNMLLTTINLLFINYLAIKIIYQRS